MKNSIKLFFGLLLTVGISSCMKDNPYPVYDGQAALEREAPILKEYVTTTTGLEGAILHETGIWYKVLEEGVQPERDSDGELIPTDYYEYNFNNTGTLEIPRVSVKYKGSLLSGVVFEEGSTADKTDDQLTTVDGFIQGWIISFLPEKAVDKDGQMREVGGLTELGLQKGSKIRIVVPSPYAYQNRSNAKIPADSPLDFTIEVLKVIPPRAR